MVGAQATHTPKQQTMAHCLHNEKIQICTVTGLPVQGLLGHIKSDGRYTWYGPAVQDYSGVGHLVANYILHLVTPLPTPVHLGTWVVITKVGNHIIQGVYSTYVGKHPHT